MRTSVRWELVLMLALAAGCDACGGGGEEPGGAELGEPGETAGTEAESPTGADPGGAPEIALRTESTDPRGVVIIVENHGRGEARLAPRVIIEREAEGAFAEVTEIQTVTLRFDCQTEAPECVTLAPGAELRPPPWRGQLGDAQCACERCVDAPHGRYRFVLRTCEGPTRIESDAFEI